MRTLDGILLCACACILHSAIACAGLSRSALDAVQVDPRPDAALPLDLRFVDERGAPRTLGEALARRPAVLVLADYTCTNLCGPILDRAAAGLERSGLRPGSDYRLVVVGIDPGDPIGAARAMKASRVGADTPLASATVFLTGDSASIGALAAAAGYRYAFDSAHDQFAHPAAAFVVTARGRIARVLSGLGLDPADLRLALVEASDGKVGTLVDRLHLLCYGFDPDIGIYTAAVTRWLALGGAATVLLLASGIAVLVRQARHRSSA